MRSLHDLKLKKLDARGLSHHALIAILVISIIAGLGAWRVWQSSAATLSLSSPYQKYMAQEDGCWLTGRIWDAAKSECLGGPNSCRPGTGEFRSVKGSDGIYRGYCSLSVAISFNTYTEARACIETYHRFYIREIGCARRPDQNNTNNARQCIGFGTSSVYKNYLADGSADKCVATSVEPTLYSATHDATIFAGVNAVRTGVGARQLKQASDCLASYARASAKRMAINDDMTHVASGTLATAAAKCGGKYAGENIAAGTYLTADRTVSAWKASSAHYKNMTNTGFTTMAVFTYKSASGNHYTAAWFMAQ